MDELHMTLESIKAARFAHRLLIIVTVIALVFAFSPREDSVYKYAVKELDTLISFNLSDLQLRYILRNQQVKDMYSQLESIVSKYSLKLMLDTYGGQIRQIVDITPTMPYYTHGASLDDIDDFITRLNDISVSIVNIDPYFKNDLSAFLDKNRNQIMQVGHMVYVGVISNTPPDKWTLGLFVIHDAERGISLESVDLGHAPKITKLVIPFNPLAEISIDKRYSNLVSSFNGHYSFLPYTRQVWDEVRSESPITARNILARKDLPSEKKMLIFGASIPQELVSKTMPGILLALSVFFLIHIKYLHQQLMVNRIRHYPWVITIPGKLSATASIATVFVLPVIALIVTIIRTWDGHFSVLFVTAIVLGVITSIFLVFALVEITAIRKSAVARLQNTG
jgi:hypothetical protein